MSDMSLRGMGAEVRFWAKVDMNGPIPSARPELGPCWQWTAGLFDNGYGAFRWEQGKTGRAHRYSFELHGGVIPEGLVLDHLCKNHACVNPTHAEPVTNGENVRRGDSFSTVNRNKTQCKHGHRFDRRSAKGRVCTTCQAEYSRQSYLRKQARKQAA